MSKNMDKKPGRVEFIRSHSARLPTPPPDPIQTPTKISEVSENLQSELTDKENEFLDYLNSLPLPVKSLQTDKPNLQRIGSMFGPAIATEDAFDHLDKLYKLMEQLLNLREQNVKLQRRVRDLEHLRNLQNLDHLVTKRVLQGKNAEVPDLDSDSIIAETLLDNMFTSNRNKRSVKYKYPQQFKFRQSILRPQRERNPSISIDYQGELFPEKHPSSKNNFNRDILRKSAKVSKWTKVKAAFKWEKASPTVSGAKSQDSGISGMMPVNNEIAKYLRVPSACEKSTETGTSPADSVLSGSWNAVHGLSTPGTLSPASSTDDLNPSATSDGHRSISRTESAGNNTSGKQFRTSRTSDEEDGERRSRSLDLTSCENSQTICKEDLVKLHGHKSHKTPWGKVIDIIQIRKDSLKRKQHRLSTRSDDCRTDYSAGSDQEDVFEPPFTTNNLITPTVKITKSENSSNLLENEKQSNTNDYSRKIPADVVARYQKVAAEEDKYQGKSATSSPKVQRRVSKWTKVKKAFLTSHARSDYDYQSAPASPTSKFSHFFIDNPAGDSKHSTENKSFYYKKLNDDIKSKKLQEEIHKSYEQLQKKLSQEFQEKLQEWERVKANSNSAATTTSTIPGGTINEEQKDSEFARKMEEWEKIKNQNNSDTKKKNLNLTSEENLPADFRKKLQEWQKIKKFGGKEDDNLVSRKKKGEWQLWRSNSSNKQENNLPLGYSEMQYSEDFLKKLDEWKQIKAGYSNSEENDNRKSIKENKSPSPGLARQSSRNKLIRQNKNYKMQEWLEKELQKIEREKQRLEREREKFLEREERLAKLRRSIGNGQHKKDVLVQTSTGFYRFEGISRKFTQRLYEWEKARGIGPEDSTFTLLNNQRLPTTSKDANINSYKNEPVVKLTRSKSMDSVANLTNVGSIITHQPSSLSLNDVEELEMQCMVESQSDRNLNESEDNLDYGEPEAVIVEVEDFVEETAAPFEDCPQENHYTPIYQTEVAKLCESEKCAAPEVRRSESVKTLTNSNAVEDSLAVLNKLRDTEEILKVAEIKLCDVSLNNTEKDQFKNTGAIPKRSKSSNEVNPYQESVNNYYEQQFENGKEICNKILLLREEYSKEINQNLNKRKENSLSWSNESINSQELLSEIMTNAEKLKCILEERKIKLNNVEADLENKNQYKQKICETTDLLILKIKKIKNSLTYLHDASEFIMTNKRKKGSYKDRKNLLHKRSSLDQISTRGLEKSTNDNTSDEDDERSKTKWPRRKEKLIKSKSEDNQILNYAKLQVTSFGDNRKERAERSYQLNKSPKTTSHIHLLSQNFDNDQCDKKELLEAIKKNKGHRKLTRTRRISDSYNDTNKNDNHNFNVIIPTQIQYLDATLSSSETSENISASPVSVFVHTTRKIFTPFTSSESEKQENVNECPSNLINNNDINKSCSVRQFESPLMSRKKYFLNISDNAKTVQEDQNNENSSPSPSCLPPLPNSPIALRRERHLPKETSPAIRLMIARYNQKLFEQDNGGNKSAGSSGSASPVAWRSPVFERRVKTQTEKYEEEVNKTLNSPFSHKQVQKSASVGVIQPIKRQITTPESPQRATSSNSSPKQLRGILKSTSAGSIKIDSQILSMQPLTSENQLISKLIEEETNVPVPTGTLTELTSNIKDRTHKLQKAKEDFLQKTDIESPGTSFDVFNFEKDKEHPLKNPRNRLSQVSFGSESSCDDGKYSGLLVKSASAGMINIDEAAFEQFRPEIHSTGYVSLPRSTKKRDGKFGISSIASKFRKVKMRRVKDPTQMNTVSTLCRQSLVVDIRGNDQENVSESSESNQNKRISSTDIHSSLSSIPNWIKSSSRIFKSKQT